MQKTFENAVIKGEIAHNDKFPFVIYFEPFNNYTIFDWRFSCCCLYVFKVICCWFVVHWKRLNQPITTEICYILLLRKLSSGKWYNQWFNPFQPADTSAAVDCWNRFDKRRNCLWWTISLFATMFSTLYILINLSFREIFYIIAKIFSAADLFYVGKG